MSDDDNQRYPSLREHLDLRERVTVVEGGQTQIMDTLRRMETLMTARAPQPIAPQQDTLMLALHNLADGLRAQNAAPKSGVANMILVALAIVGMGALGFIFAGIIT